MNLNSTNSLNNISEGSIINLNKFSYINNEQIIHSEFNGKTLLLFTYFKIYLFKQLGKKEKYECIQIRSSETKFKHEKNEKYELDNITEFMETMDL